MSDPVFLVPRPSALRRACCLIGSCTLGLGLLACSDDAAPSADAGNLDARFADAGACDGGANQIERDAGIATCEPGSTGTTYVFVLDSMSLGGQAGAEAGVLPGFDLDGRTSDMVDEQGCFQVDFRSGPPDNIEGVDNQIAPLMDTFGIRDEFDDRFLELSRAGELLTLVVVEGVDDLANDSCVHVSVLLGRLPVGTTQPAVTPEQRLSAGQVFDIDATWLEADRLRPRSRFGSGRIASGRLHAQATTPIELKYPPFLSEPVRVVHHLAQLAADIQPDVLTNGVFGGAAITDEFIARNAEAIPSPEAVRASFNTYADIWPGACGQCAGISLGGVFSAVGAVRGQVVDP